MRLSAISFKCTYESVQNRNNNYSSTVFNAATKTATFYVLNQNRKEKQLSFNTTKLLRIPHLRAGFFSLHALRRFTDLLNPHWEVRKQSRIKSECNNKTWKRHLKQASIKRHHCMHLRYEVTCKNKQQIIGSGVWSFQTT